MGTIRLNGVAPHNSAESFGDASVGDLLGALIRIQAMQIATVLSWQRAFFAMHDELRDEWICRWAGGVPLDA